LPAFNQRYPIAASTLDRAHEAREAVWSAFGTTPNLVDKMAGPNPTEAQVYFVANGAVEDDVLSPAG